jgi:hypothetical protein
MGDFASPCPFDQVSMIVLKKCPILWTVLWRIIKHIPAQWKAGLTVLAYKKGPTDNLNMSDSKYDYFLRRYSGTNVEKSAILLLKIEENGWFLEIWVMISSQGMVVFWNRLQF